MASAFIFISSVVALADSSDEARVFPMPLYDDPLYESMASGDALRATEYTTTDIYNLLYSALRGENYMSIYSLPMIASYTDRIAQTLYGTGQSVPSTSLYTLTSNILSSLTCNFGQGSVPLGVVVQQMMLDTADIKTNSYNSAYYLNQINSKLDDPYNWLSYPYDYVRMDGNLGGPAINFSTTGSSWFPVFHSGSTFTSLPGVIRLFIPLSNTYNYYSSSVDAFHLSHVYTLSNNSWVEINIPDYFIEMTSNGFYCYLFDFNPFPGYDMTLNFTFDHPVYFSYGISVSASYIPFDTDDYQQIKQAFYQQKASDSLSGLDKLVEVYASPDKIAAEQAQQGVESQVLDDFTGQGSASMGLGDVAGVKDVSTNAKQFLGTGYSGSSALSLFSVNGQGLWQWFSQTTADNLDTTSNNRKSSDEYLSVYDDYMEDYYKGMNRNDYAY